MQSLPHRAILSLTGPDTLALMERTVTHKVADWAEGELRYGALLTPQGKVIVDYLALRTGDGVLIDVHEDAADDLVKRLKLFRLRSAVEITRDDARAAATGEAGAEDPRSAALPRRGIVPASEVSGALDPRDYEAARLAAGVAEWGADYRAAEVFPTDINMDVMGGVDYRKGCFVGQEVASRMKRKGLIRKRTVRIAGAGLEPGAEVRAGTALLGTVTSCLGAQGLALLRTDRWAKAVSAGEAAAVGDAPAELRPAPWLEDEMKTLLETPGDD